MGKRGRQGARYSTHPSIALSFDADGDIMAFAVAEPPGYWTAESLALLAYELLALGALLLVLQPRQWHVTATTGSAAAAAAVAVAAATPTGLAATGIGVIVRATGARIGVGVGVAVAGASAPIREAALLAARRALALFTTPPPAVLAVERLVRLLERVDKRAALPAAGLLDLLDDPAVVRVEAPLGLDSNLLVVNVPILLLLDGDRSAGAAEGRRQALVGVRVRVYDDRLEERPTG
jgi:hypothetical protein